LPARRRNLFKKTIPLIIVALLVSLLVGCNGTTETMTSIELVPQSADIVGKINMSQILGDKDLTGLYDSLPKDSDTPQTFDDAVDMVIEEAGIDLRDFEEALIFGDTSSGTEDTNYFGAIVEGTFTKGDLIAAIEEAMDIELDPFDYKGYEIYTDQDQQGAIVFLNDETSVIGTVELVKDVIDVKKGDEPVLSGEVLDRYNELGDVLMKVSASIASELMEGALEDAQDFIPIPIDLSALADIETAALTLDKEEQSIAFDLELYFSDAKSAKAVKALITLATAMIDMFEIPQEGPGGIPIPQEGQELLPELLDKLDVEVVDSCLTISLHMTLSEIEDLLAEQEAE
jgi:hypothetical protein